VKPIEHLQERRMALLGLGVENRALARFLLGRGLRFSVRDRQAPPDLQDLRAEFGERVQEWRLGPDYLQDLEHFDLLFRTPGLPLRRPELQRARQAGAEISSQTRLFFALSPAPILGVTGTKGKGTTTSLIAAILEKSFPGRIFTGGNIGRPPISFLDELGQDHLVILELSSFQLHDLDRSPHLALVLAITPDHLDYHADPEEYVEAKKSICRHQGEGDFLAVNADCPRASAFAGHSRAQCWAFGISGQVQRGAWVHGGKLQVRRPGGEAEAICEVAQIPLRGPHNWSNAAAAAAAAAMAGASAEQIREGIRTFRGLPHRLEKVAERQGVSYYNDSLATTPEAAIAALESFSEPLILIAGGASKGADFSALGQAIARCRVRAVILMGEEASRIETAIRRTGRFAGELFAGCRSLEQAVAQARALAQPGDVVLLSPACASFDMFSSYQERGERFRGLVLAGD
jgi:UDP-N-acetylmuramoylalanine--D-glutamate ligase